MKRSANIEAAYEACRAIAKREAKNFYYAFRVLPRHKADAMSAVYAFMRKADDLADDESLSVQARRTAMAAWTESWRKSRVETQSDPVFVALRDTQFRFSIPDSLFEQLVAGTTLDLQETQPGVAELELNGHAGKQDFQVYRTFDDLYRYCYLVASVVGLVCIRIFGYTDSAAEKLAEETGVAFQLTNILRDVHEDAERGRIYLPLEDMAANGTDPAALLVSTCTGTPQPDVLNVLNAQIVRAQQYYMAADRLIPLLAPDSRPAMRVLVQIYRELLERIAAEPAAVFRMRLSVPKRRKLAILARGIMGSLLARGRS